MTNHKNKKFLVGITAGVLQVCQVVAGNAPVHIEIPILASIDEAKVPTSLHADLIYFEIKTPVDDWVAEQHSSADDVAFAKLLRTILNKQASVLKSLVVNNDRGSITDENVFAETMHQGLVREKYTPVVLGKTLTPSGALYAVEMAGPKPYVTKYLLVLTDPENKQFLWDLNPEHASDSVLQNSFDPRASKVLQGTGRFFDLEYLSVAFLGSVVLNQQEMQAAQDCINNFVQSEMREGVTEGSRVRVENSVSGNPQQKQKFLKSFSEQHCKLKFLFHFEPLYIGFFENSCGLDFAYFVKKDGKFFLTNLNRQGEMDRLLRQVVTGNKGLQSQILEKISKAALELAGK